MNMDNEDWQGETKYPEKCLLQCYFVHQNFCKNCPAIEPKPS
jgi:hypothetical protein